MFHNPSASPPLSALQAAQAHAQAGRFAEMLAFCQQIMATQADDVVALLDVGVLLLNFGYLSRARECFERVRVLAPEDLRPVVNLANLAREAGDHAQSRRLYDGLVARQPQHPVIRRNALVSGEYDPRYVCARSSTSRSRLGRLGHKPYWWRAPTPGPAPAR